MTNHTAAYLAKKLLKLFGPNGKHWCRGSGAKTKSGETVKVSDPRAVKFCMSGGLEKLGGTIKGRILLKNAITKIAPNTRGIVEFNDSHYFSTVKRVLKQIAAGA